MWLAQISHIFSKLLLRAELIAVLDQKDCNTGTMRFVMSQTSQLIVLLITTILLPNAAFAQAWALPTLISDTNTKISFAVASTWHTIQGNTSQLTGTISQSIASDPLTVVVNLSIPVNSFDTQGKSRDERLQEVMNSREYPVVRFASSRLSPSCHPLRVVQNKSCDGNLEGTLTIRDVSRPVSLPIHIQLKDTHYDIHGSFSINWADYHVEDPSILIAKLAPSVSIDYRIRIPQLQSHDIH